MRNNTKLKILELLEIVNEALRYIKIIENKDKKNSLQTCAQRMQTVLHTLTQAGAGGGLMAMKLRQFDQSLARAIGCVDQPDAFAEAAAVLAEQFALIRNKVEKIQPKLEIVFLPYKASMWDSMESIWRAAMADKTCNAHVIPIPYYDLNVDLTIAKYYDESSLFPEDVPITDYRGYDLAKNRPDIIYFHNPYDGENLVTSVLPEFYSDKLKQYTDMLVYVPYFVEFGELGETLAQKPGCANADLIIAHSEANKKSYMEYYPAEKIAVLGAPQIDKVLRTHEHRPELPEEWRRIAKGRKLILYNMSLISLMRKDGSACRKLRYVFSCFSGRQDVCLLWRPHPLSVATMNSMNERVLAEYQELIKVYREKKLGIYDDSPDVHRAIELSDAYYGDWSSLVPMYEATGKPIMMQNIEACNKVSEEEKGYLAFWDVVIEDNAAWFSSCHFNGLFKMDMATGLTSFVRAFPGEFENYMYYSKTLKVGSKLYFIPWLAKSIAEFDMATEEFKSYALPDLTGEAVVKSRTAFLWGEWICSIPTKCQFLFKFNVRSGELKIYDHWYEKLLPFLQGESSTLFQDAVQVGNFAWCPCSQGNLVVRFNLKDMKADFYEVGILKHGFYSIDYDGEIFWLLSGMGEVVRWNPHSSDVQVNDTFSDKIKGEGKAGIFCRYCADILYIFAESGKIITMDTKSGRMADYKQYPRDFKRDGDSGWILKSAPPEVRDGILSVFSFKENAWLQISAKTGESRSWKIRLSPDGEKKLNHPHRLFSKENMKESGPLAYCYHEFGLLTLSNYIKHIAGKQVDADKNQASAFGKCIAHADGICGKYIHQHVRENLPQSVHS